MTKLEDVEGMACVDVFEIYCALEVLLLNLEMVSVLVSHDPQYFQTVNL